MQKKPIKNRNLSDNMGGVTQHHFFSCKKKSGAGFTLVEIMVSLSIFVIIMVVIMGAILGIFDINNKVQTQKTALDNINFALESMSRTIRFGTNYHCGSITPLTSPSDCPTSAGLSTFSVTASDGSLITYALVGARLVQAIGSNILELTSPEVIIQSVVFRVFGSSPYSSGDMFQPQVIITISGTSGSVNKPKTQSTFRLETTVSQRKLDI